MSSVKRYVKSKLSQRLGLSSCQIILPGFLESEATLGGAQLDRFQKEKESRL